VLFAMFVAAARIGSSETTSPASSPLRLVALAPPRGLREAAMVSEPHLAIDPARPTRLVAVAQTRDLVAWRSANGGATWSAGRPLAGSNGRDGYASGDPVVAVGRGGAVLLAAVSIDQQGKCTLLNRVGSYRSEDGGRSFGALAAAGATSSLPRRFFGQPPIPSCPLPRGLTRVTTYDKPWLALDVTSGAHAGSVYLSWSRNEQHNDGSSFPALLLAASRDGGRSYGRPVVVAARARRPAELEHYSQVAVRPDGTVDLVWNDVRRDRIVVLHASSRNGGATFGSPELVYTLPRSSTAVGLVSSLAVSAAGRLALCWAASIRPKAYLPRIGCALSSGDGTWSQPATPFPNGGWQYLPAASFQGERLWVAAYRSTAETTRVLLVSSDDGRTFSHPVTLAARRFGRSRLCAPHPPDCGPRQRFIGDYIGAVAAPGKVSVAFVLPAAGVASPNRVFVATLTTS
jgi:hypothetical protein